VPRWKASDTWQVKAIKYQGLRVFPGRGVKTGWVIF